MRKAGHADIPLHGGKVPEWLANRMAKLGRAISESIITEYGRDHFLNRLSDPMWFQCFGAVLGMDWHSSGITTSVLGALKRSLNPISKDLGIVICGGRGKHALKTPNEINEYAYRTGVDGEELIRSSRLSAKVDSTAIQDGFQIYLHSFIVTDAGKWIVIQQGMNDATGMARRYHWHSDLLKGFLNDPHKAVTGINQGEILNLASTKALTTRDGIIEITKEKPIKIVQEARNMRLPTHHDIRGKDVNLKRLGAILALAQEKELHDFETLLLLEGLGPRTLQSLTLVSEVIHGTPSRFTDPARFAFAHGGKDGHPFPVPLKIYDKTITTLTNAIERSKIGHTDKTRAIKKLSILSKNLENGFTPNADFNKVIQKERRESYKNGGRTVFGKIKKPESTQLSLF